MYDIIIINGDQYRMIPMKHRQEAIQEAQGQVQDLLEDHEGKWAVKVFTGTQLIWHDSSRNRLLGLDSGPTFL